MAVEFERKVRVRGIIPYDGKFMFVQHKHDQSFWALPGGGLEDGETLEQGLVRELIEELGVRPIVGKLLYVQQLALAGSRESLEFFFHIENGADFVDIDINSTTHGGIELAKAEFIDPAQTAIRVMPGFLSRLGGDIVTADWPKVFVRSVDKI